METMKCKGCKQTLGIECFSKDKSRHHGYHTRCKACDRAYAIKKRYGADASLLLTRECECCGVELKQGNKGKDKLNIDHDHVTGDIRGVICHACNSLLGHAYDDIDRLGMAAAYLRKHNLK